MISLKGATKRFGDILAIDSVSAEIKNGSVFGLIGTNGAGKSTFLRMVSGVIKPDEGEVSVDGGQVFENTAIKEKLFYISDEQYFFSNATPREMRDFYASRYPRFDKGRFDSMIKSFSLDPDRKIATFSKGMKKQVSVICAVSAMTDYILCDETFDGLDPVMRQAVKSIFAGDVAQRGLTPVIASHNLRELEDICDHIGLLHKGGILFTKDLEDMKLGLQKIQCVPKGELTQERLAGLDILTMEKRGSLYTITVRASRERANDVMMGLNTIFYELLPLTLEEIFISETEVAGYDVKKLIL